MTCFPPTFLNFASELANMVISIIQCHLEDKEMQADCSAYTSTLWDRFRRAFCKARKSLASAWAQQKAQYDSKNRDLVFEVGNLLLKRNQALSDAS